MNRSTINRLARIEIACLNYNAVSNGHKPPAKSRILLKAGIREAKRQLLTWMPKESDLIDLERVYGMYYKMNMRAIVRVYAPKENHLYETVKSLRTGSGQGMVVRLNFKREIIISEFIFSYFLASVGLVSMGVSLVNRYLI